MMTEQSNQLTNCTKNLRLNDQTQLNGTDRNLSGASVVENGVERPVPHEILELLEAILSLQSPDDLQVHTLAAQIRSITNEVDYRWLCSHMCSGVSSNRQAASVVAAVCREIASHAVGAVKLRSQLFRTAQAVYDEHEHISKVDHEKFVTGTLFLGELFYYIKSESGAPFAVLAEPLVTMLNKILQKHLKELPSCGAKTSENSRHHCKKFAPKTVDSQACQAAGPVAVCHRAAEEADSSDVNGAEEEPQANDGQKSDPCDADKDASDTKEDELPENFSGDDALDEDGKLIQNSHDEKVECNDAQLSKSSAQKTRAPQAEGSESLANLLDEDIMVVARQLLHNGDWLLRLCPTGVTAIVLAMTELMCRACLSSTATLQVASALAEMWPLLSVSVHPRTSHAVLAARMGLSLNL